MEESVAKKNPAEEFGRGRVLLFIPTGERVTIMRPKVGRNYHGDWIHEVVNREGKEFLASERQLK